MWYTDIYTHKILKPKIKEWVIFTFNTRGPQSLKKQHYILAVEFSMKVELVVVGG